MLKHRGSLSFGCVVLENAFTRAGCITLGTTDWKAVCYVYCISFIEEVANTALSFLSGLTSGSRSDQGIGRGILCYLSFCTLCTCASLLTPK